MARGVAGQVGALEYDPELPGRQAHRQWLAERVVFKEVVPIQDAALRAKIHQTYRLAYIKDVVLPRVLDDATFATFSSLILFNNVEVGAALPRRSPCLWLSGRPGTWLQHPRLGRRMHTPCIVYAGSSWQGLRPQRLS